MTRAVLDANVLVSTLLSPHDTPAEVLSAWHEGQFDLVTSAAILSEVGRVDVVSEDPEDDRYLECAVEGGADYVVSGDRYLLRLRQYEGIPIVSPAVFLRVLREEPR